MDESMMEKTLLHFMESMTTSIESVLSGHAMKGLDNGTTAGSFRD